jgi:hypothetical protein
VTSIPTRSPARHRARFPAALLALALAACGSEAGPAAPPARAAAPVEPQPIDWPAGTVLAVDDRPITLDEVDLASVWIERIQPEVSGRQLRRLALTNVTLMQALAELSAEPGERQRARAEAEERLAALSAGELAGPPNPDGGLGEVAEGNWQVLGIPLWGQALDWEPDSWQLIEEPGRFVVARRLKRTDEIHPTAISLSIDAFVFPYLPEDLVLERAIDDHRLTFVDPSWREIVPEHTQYRMGVHSSP